MNLRFTFLSLLIFLFLGTTNAQLSFLSKLDSFPGSASEFVPLPVGFLTVNASYENNDDYGFRMTKFDKCGAVEWAKEYSSEDLFLQSFGSPEAVMDRSGFIYLVLSHGVEQGEGFVLLKLDQGGNIEWSYLMHGTQQSDKYTASNLLYSRFTDTLAISLNNDLDNAMLVQFNSDGELLNQRQFPGFRYHSSSIDNDGAIVLASDTAIMKVDSDFELEWAKRLNSHSFFIQSNDPIFELDGQINLMAVDTFGTQLDSFYYSLVTLTEEGDLYSNSDGIRGVNYGNVDLQERGANTFLFLDRGRATTIEGNTSMIGSHQDFNFCPDTIPFCSSNMNTCIDNSLLLSGFYYESPDSITFFMGKTDPDGALNCDESNIPLDSVPKSFVQMDSIFFESEAYTIQIDTAAFEVVDFTPMQEMPCFQAIVENQDQDFQPCPCDEQSLAVQWLKGADYLWSTGDSTNVISVDTTGIYTVDVNLCGTEERSTMNVNYKDLAQCVGFTDDSPQCPGLITTLRVLHDYGDQLDLNWSTIENGDSIKVTTEGAYTVNLHACGWSDSHTFNIAYLDIENEECKPVYIPSAFVPNSTSYDENKEFKIYTKLDATNFTAFNMVVFDRWGEKVYEGDDPFSGWDGNFRNRKMPPGVYLYVISYEIDLGGEPFSKTEKGQVLLVK